MKKSQYVSRITISDRYTLLYNALTNVFLILTPELLNLWESFPSAALNRNLNLRRQLIKDGFIIDSDIDEAKHFISNLTENLNDESNYHLIINPTLNCNLSCWYCYETHSKSKMDVNTSRKIKKLITNILCRDKLEHLHLSFFGGEPFMFFDSIIKHILHYAHFECIHRNKELSLSFTTNGSLINNRILSELRSFEGLNINFQITLDGDKTCHNRVRYFKNGKGTYEIIILNIKQILQHGFSVVMRINFTQDNIDSLSYIIKDISDPIFINNKNFQVDFQQVWQDKSSYQNISERIDDCISIFRKSGVKVLYHYINRMNDPCYADKLNELIINYNGQVYKCTAQDFDKTISYGSLNDCGGIDWNESMLETREKYILPPDSCLTCRIAPICGGGCSQHLIGNKDNQHCILNNDEELIDKFILDKFENQFMK